MHVSNLPISRGETERGRASHREPVHRVLKLPPQILELLLVLVHALRIGRLFSDLAKPCGYVAAFASSLRDGWKTLLDGSFNRLQRPGCSRTLEQHEQARWSDVLFEAIHISLHHKLKRIVPRALLLEDAGDGNEESCGLLAELGKAFAVLLNGLSPR
jgi:hypothetical protein